MLILTLGIVGSLIVGTSLFPSFFLAEHLNHSQKAASHSAMCFACICNLHNNLTGIITFLGGAPARPGRVAGGAAGSRLSSVPWSPSSGLPGVPSGQVGKIGGANTFL